MWVPLSIMVTTVFVRLAGSQVTVKVSALVAFITLLPCVLFMVWGVKDIDAAVFVKTAGVPCIPPVASLCDRHAGSWRFGEYISWMLWINSGFFSLGSMAAEIVSPQRTYVMATALLVPLVIIFNALPQAIAMSLEGDQSKFEAGLFGDLAGKMAGTWLSTLFVVASNVCLIGLHNSTIMSAERAVAFLLPAATTLKAGSHSRCSALNTWLLVLDPRLGVPRSHIIGCFCCPPPPSPCLFSSSLF